MRFGKGERERGAIFCRVGFFFFFCSERRHSAEVEIGGGGVDCGFGGAAGGERRRRLMLRVLYAVAADVLRYRKRAENNRAKNETYHGSGGEMGK